MILVQLDYGKKIILDSHSLYFHIFPKNFVCGGRGAAKIHSFNELGAMRFCSGLNILKIYRLFLLTSEENFQL